MKGGPCETGRRLIRRYPVRRCPVHRYPGLLAALFVLAGLLAACDSTEPDLRGTVEGRVLVDDAPLAGAVVELTGPASRSETTDAEGRYRFEEVPTGAYVVSIRDVPADAAFQATSRTAVLSDESTVSVEFRGNFIRTTSLSGRVTSRDQGLAAVTVELAGPDTLTTETNAAGSYTFSALRSGTYQLSISGFPSTVNFSPVSRSIVLDTGEDRVQDFRGTPELTATAVIRGVRAVLPAGGTGPVDLDELRGRIQVEVGVEPGEDTPDSIQVLLDDQVIGTQRFGSGTDGSPAGATAVGDEALATRLDLFFEANTARFDSATAEPRFLNGETELTVRLATREGGPEAWTSSVPVVLDNRDTFMASVEATRGPVTGADGWEWVAGDLEVVLVPVAYSGREVTSVTAEIRRAGGGQVATRSVGGSSPFRVPFPATGDGSDALEGYQTPADAVDRVRILSAGYSGGGPGMAGLPRVVLDSLRIDQVAPAADSIRLPAQGEASDCCRESWVGADFPFASVVVGLDESGVGLATVRVHAGPSELSDTDLLALPPVERGSDLEATEANTAYRALVVLEDALGNEEVLPLLPTSANPAVGSSGARFGVDLLGPDVSLDTSGSGLGESETNPPAGSRWVLDVENAGASGLGSLPARIRIQRFGPDAPSGGQCVLPAGADPCVAVPAGLVRNFQPTGPGLYVFEARVLDRAGNPSVLIRSEVQVDEDDISP